MRKAQNIHSTLTAPLGAGFALLLCAAAGMT